MEKHWVWVTVIVVLVIGCGKPSVVKLKKGTPAYETAKEAAMKVPELDPDKNRILAESDYFRISAGEVVAYFFDNLGSGASHLSRLGEKRIRDEVERALIQLTERKLLYRAALKTGRKATEAEVDSMLERQYQHPNFGSKENFEAWIAQQGIRLDFIRGEFAQVLTIQKGLDVLLGDSIEVTEEELQAAYQKDKTATVRHILLITQGKSESEKQALYHRMEEILSRARGGEDFAALAKAYSEDPGSRDRGGLYEDFERGIMVKPFEEAAFSVDVGEISDIIETPYGYHILKVIARKKERKPFEEVRDALKAELEAEKRIHVYEAYVQRLKDESRFRIRFPAT